MVAIKSFGFPSLLSYPLPLFPVVARWCRLKHTNATMRGEYDQYCHAVDLRT